MDHTRDYLFVRPQLGHGTSSVVPHPRTLQDRLRRRSGQERAPPKEQDITIPLYRICVVNLCAGSKPSSLVRDFWTNLQVTSSSTTG